MSLSHCLFQLCVVLTNLSVYVSVSLPIPTPYLHMLVSRKCQTDRLDETIIFSTATLTRTTFSMVTCNRTSQRDSRVTNTPFHFILLNVVLPNVAAPISLGRCEVSVAKQDRLFVG